VERGLGRLKKEVLSHWLCTACGACAGLCPYIVTLEDRVAGVGECRESDGDCFRFCPRTGPVEGEGDSGLHGDAGYGGPVGSYESTGIARSGRRSDGFQYGGAVTALMIRALRDGVIDAAVLTTMGKTGPKTITATTEEEIRACAGSKYAVAPTVSEVNRVRRGFGGRLGVVALPCQVTALRKISEAEGQEASGTIALIVGLFCTWALTQRGWGALLGEEPGPDDLGRVDIPPPPADVMEVDLRGERLSLPLREVKEHIRPACRVCLDMTAENADISVGTVEGREGWSTLVIRTKVGRELVERAGSQGDLEREELDQERWRHLQDASLGKKERAIASAEVEGDMEPLPFLLAVSRVKEQIQR